MGLPVDQLCVTLNFTPLKFVAIFVIMKKKIALSLEYVSLRKKILACYYSS